MDPLFAAKSFSNTNDYQSNAHKHTKEKHYISEDISDFHEYKTIKSIKLSLQIIHMEIKVNNQTNNVLCPKTNNYIYIL